jgi:hypothetical protein
MLIAIPHLSDAAMKTLRARTYGRDHGPSSIYLCTPPIKSYCLTVTDHLSPVFFNLIYLSD